jgi:N-dimethylarginine dimethylaminohydrolase
MPGDTARRTARARTYLMCPPQHFRVEYAINPWMDPRCRLDAPLARAQWDALRGALRALGHRVELVAPRPGLPDMVFTANAATVIDARVLVSTFRHPQRAGESAAFERWFRRRGYRRVRRARAANEGEGDHLLAGGLILAGHGPRTDPASHRETGDYFGRPVVGLTLRDPRYYHLDTALAVLDGREIMYYPEAFSGPSVDRLRALFPDALEAGPEDAAVFGLNAISDGYHVVLPAAAARLAARLARRGFKPVPVELGELHKAGGGPKCCVLELRAARTAPAPTVREAHHGYRHEQRPRIAAAARTADGVAG